jgi:hypothetical protein
MGYRRFQQLAPSLARRYDGSDGPPPKRQCRLDSIGSHGMPSKAVEGTGGCFLVTTNWLERSLITGAPADVNLFEIQQGVTAMRPAERVQRVQHVPAAEIKAAFADFTAARSVPLLLHADSMIAALMAAAAMDDETRRKFVVVLMTRESLEFTRALAVCRTSCDPYVYKTCFQH